MKSIDSISGKGFSDHYDPSALEKIRAALQHAPHGWSQSGAKLLDAILREIDALEHSQGSVADLNGWLASSSGPVAGLKLSQDDLENFSQASLQITPSAPPFDPSEYEKIKSILNNPSWPWSQSGAQVRNDVFAAINEIEQENGTLADLQKLLDQISTKGVSQIDLEHFTEAFQGTSLKLSGSSPPTPTPPPTPGPSHDKAMQDLYDQLSNVGYDGGSPIDPKLIDLRNYLMQLQGFMKDFQSAWSQMVDGFQRDWSGNPVDWKAVLEGHNGALEQFMKYYGGLFDERLQNIAKAIPPDFSFEGEKFSGADFINFIKGLSAYNRELKDAPGSSVQKIPTNDPTYEAPAHILPSSSDRVSKTDNASVTYYNKSGKDVNILVLGTDPANGRDCYIYYRGGVPCYKDVEYDAQGRAMTYAEDYTCKLSDFPRTPDGGYQILLPPGKGRIYTSDSKLSLNIDQDKICEPNPTSKSDANDQTIYDQVEWSNVNHLLTMNTTAVDYFGLPISISMNTGNGPETSGVDVGRAQAFQQISAELQAAGSPWDRLIEKGRILSPNQYISEHPDQADAFFPKDWLSKVQSYFETHSLQIDARELGLDPANGIYTSSYDAASKMLTFTNAAGNQVRIPIDHLSVLQVVSGNGPVSFAKDTPGRIITRDLMALIDSNLLTTVPSGALVNKQYFIDHHDACYKPDAAGLNFIDHYAKAMHQLGNIYAFSSDDVMGYDGTEEGSVSNANASITLQPF